MCAVRIPRRWRKQKTQCCSCNDDLPSRSVYFLQRPAFHMLCACTLVATVRVCCACVWHLLRQASTLAVGALELDARFDCYLVRPEHIAPLFIVVNDERFALREASVSVVRRLAAMNPAYVLPPLRRTLMQVGAQGLLASLARSLADFLRGRRATSTG